MKNLEIFEIGAVSGCQFVQGCNVTDGKTTSKDIDVGDDKPLEEVYKNSSYCGKNSFHYYRNSTHFGNDGSLDKFISINLNKNK